MKRKSANTKTLVTVLTASFGVLTLGIGGLALLLTPKNQGEKPVTPVAGSRNEVSTSSSSALLGADEMVFPASEGESPLSEIPQKEPDAAESQVSSLEETSLEAASEQETASAPAFDFNLPLGETVQTATFHVPDKLHGVMIVPGDDYLTNPAAGPVQAKQEIDAALKSVKELGLNTVILDTKYENKVVFKSRVLESLATEFDFVDYLVQQARAQDLYVYATYDVTDAADSQQVYKRANALDGSTMDTVMLATADFTSAYGFDGILLNNYYQTSSGSAYNAYLMSGGGMGFESYRQQVPKSLLTTAAQLIRRVSPNTQVGLLSDSVWANENEHPEGTKTSAKFSALTDGGVDTRGLMMEGLFDFVMVKNYGATTDQSVPFGEVAAWWAKQGQASGTVVYMMHASGKIASQNPGWSAPEQLATQMIELNKLSGISGSAFNSLPALVKNTGDAASMVMKYLEGDINEDYILTQLSMSKPDKTEFSTQEPSVTFQGASDPQEKVTINDEEITADDNGYFSVVMDLEAGDNTFVVKHKSKSVTYKINRIVEVVKDVQPAGAINVEGGMEVRISALAYEGASVSATLGSQTVSLTAIDDVEDEELRASGYVIYEGFVTAPAAAPAAVSLGAVSVTGTWQGVTKTVQGGNVTVNKIVQVGDGGVVMIKNPAAETFPANTLNNTSSSSHYPLPKGTIDTTVGQKVVYTSGSKTYEFWKLSSGVRVYADDLQAVSANPPGGNAISKVRITPAGLQTLVKITTGQKVPYTVSYNGTKISFNFKYTTSLPGKVDVEENAMFSAGAFSDSTLSLTLKKQGGFMGYSAVYEDDTTLVLAFMNPTSTLSGARIVIDPGHGGGDTGATGFYPGMDEREINGQMAAKIAAALQSRGASVLVTTQGTTLAQRMAQAAAFQPHMMVSVHGNSSAINPAAAGTEVYYFYGASKPLASTLAAQVAAAMGTANRGAKSGLYYTTRSSQFLTVLLEVGFVSNQQEYAKLLNDSYQSRVASAVANSLSAVLGAANTGTNLSGGNLSGGGSNDDNEEEEESQGLTPLLRPEEENKVKLNKTELILEAGETFTLKLENTAAEIRWAVKDNAIASVKADGTVEGLDEGSTQVAAVVGDKAYYCNVTVNKKSESSSVSTEQTMTIEGNSSLTVKERQAYELSEEYKNGSILWSVDKEGVVEFLHSDERSCQVEAIGEGSVTLYATDKNTQATVAKITVTVGK